MLVVLDLEVLPHEVVDRLYAFANDQPWELADGLPQLLIDLIDVVEVDVCVTSRPDELADLQVAEAGDHVGQQRVAGDVEGYTQEHVGTPLIHLARQLAVRDVELEERVARFEPHVGQLGDVPGADHHSTRVRVGLDRVDHLGDLVDLTAVLRSPVSPLNAVDRTEVSLVVGPLVPDLDAVVEQVLNALLAAQEPQQLDRDRLEAHELGCDQRKALLQIVDQLGPEDALRTRSCAVPLFDTIIEDLDQEILKLSVYHYQSSEQGRELEMFYPP